MGRALATLAACAILLPAGCGDETPVPTGGGTITYSRSGGIAGIGELLEVEEDGAAKLTLGYGPDARVVRFEVPATELQAITARLEAVDFEEIDAGPEPTCADCFAYEVRFGGETATSDSVTSTKAFARAVEPLARLVAQRLPAGTGVKGG